MFLISRARTAPDASYKEYDYYDIFDDPTLTARGTGTPLEQDMDAAVRIADALPMDDPYAAMLALSKLTEKGTTGELFNSRWQSVANPLIVKFFHELKYNKTPYPGDCTPWCAATLSWCLQRAKYSIPHVPASSQSFSSYGTPVDEPKQGDICVFGDVGDGAHGHVAFFVQDAGNDLIEILGANQGGGAPTNCGPGYRQSKVSKTHMPRNKARDPKISVLYLEGYVRPAKI
jgi:uncharacterized protein (TIGR02594 family)